MKSHSSGQALAELALVLPILVVTVLGAAELLRLHHDRMILIMAARSAVRTATIEWDAVDAARNEAKRILEANGKTNLESLRMHLDRWLGDNTLKLSYDTNVSPAVRHIFGDTITIEAKAHMSRPAFAWY